MAAYFIAQIDIDDPDGYQDYLAGFMPIFDRHKGRLLTVSSKPVERIEGDWHEGGIVLMEFPDLAAAKAWKDDPDYIELAKIRQATASTNLVLVEGL
ncbi:DUF1330 domain-containing protein [Ruegeria sp. HKCCA4008]|uniref:DUF1330 domain-containing protein n=1 Tax=Ruegeria sp. HKCCA4008 TaxID=2682999 RepID=UPI001488C742|nr:DUF1330 domain-containing protein [Ruegeria sp. HKCCA4008]